MAQRNSMHIPPEAAAAEIVVVVVQVEYIHIFVDIYMSLYTYLWLSTWLYPQQIRQLTYSTKFGYKHVNIHKMWI